MPSVRIEATESARTRGRNSSRSRMHAEAAGRRRRDGDVEDLARLQAVHPDGGAIAQSGDLRKLGVDHEQIVEQEPAIADHEQSEREDHQSTDNEDADTNQPCCRRH